MEQLSPLDASFLVNENSTVFSHIGWLSTFEIGSVRPLSVPALRQLIEQRIHLVPTFRRRLIEVPLGLDRPYWIEDPDFDLDFHVRGIAVPPPGDRYQLADLISRLQARPLDRSRPLWELYLVEGLQDDRVGVYAKMHLSAIDPLSGTEIMTVLLDASPDGSEIGAPSPSDPEPAPSPTKLLLRAGLSLASQPRAALGFVRRSVERAEHAMASQFPATRDMWLEVLQRTPGVHVLARPPSRGRQGRGDQLLSHPGLRAPRVSFNHAMTPHRRIAFTSLPFANIHSVKQACGTTANDVVMAICAGGLRKWLAERHELPSTPLLAMIPIMVGSADSGRVRRQVSGMIAALPTNEPDPIRRLELAHQGMRVAKDQHAAVPATVLQDMALFAPPAVGSLAARLAVAMSLDLASPTFNLAISNLPGPDHPLYCAGARQVASYPLSVVWAAVGLHISLVSNDGNLHLGFVSGGESASDLWSLADGIADSLAELQAASGSPAGT